MLGAWIDVVEAPIWNFNAYLISGRPIYRLISSIFQKSASADKLFCLADAFEAGLLFWRRWERQCLSTQCSHSPTYLWHSPSCLLSSLTVLSNMDRSLSNNQIELLNKGIKRYTKKYYNDCFYIISNRKANIIILSRLPSAFSKCTFISFKQSFEWLMNILFHKPCRLVEFSCEIL